MSDGRRAVSRLWARTASRVGTATPGDWLARRVGLLPGIGLAWPAGGFGFFFAFFCLFLAGRLLPGFWLIAPTRLSNARWPTAHNCPQLPTDCLPCPP